MLGLLPSSFLPLRVVDVCPPTTENCGGLHSTGITQLLRYPGLHPRPPWLLPASVLPLCWHTRHRSVQCQDRVARLVRSPSPCVARCCLRPRSGRPSLVFLRHGPCCLRPSQENRPAQIHHDIGANYQIQRLTLHLATSAQLRVSPLVLRSRVSALTLSIVRRVPSYSLNSPYTLRRAFGMTDYFFPRGVPSLLNVNPFQVYCDCSEKKRDDRTKLQEAPQRGARAWTEGLAGRCLCGFRQFFNRYFYAEQLQTTNVIVALLLDVVAIKVVTAEFGVGLIAL